MKSIPWQFMFKWIILRHCCVCVFLKASELNYTWIIFTANTSESIVTKCVNNPNGFQITHFFFFYNILIRLIKNFGKNYNLYTFMHWKAIVTWKKKSCSYHTQFSIQRPENAILHLIIMYINKKTICFRVLT